MIADEEAHMVRPKSGESTESVSGSPRPYDSIQSPPAAPEPPKPHVPLGTVFLFTFFLIVNTLWVTLNLMASILIFLAALMTFAGTRNSARFGNMVNGSFLFAASVFVSFMLAALNMTLHKGPECTSAPTSQPTLQPTQFATLQPTLAPTNTTYNSTR